MPFDHFDFLSPLYDRVIPPSDGAKMRQYLEPQPDMILLDAGGGTGRVAQTLTEDFRHIVLADISLGMLSQARMKGFDCAAAHTEQLPFPEGVFDRVLMVDALHHVCNQAETVRDLFRVLKPGGRLVIQEPNIKTFGVKLIALGEKLALMRSHFLNAQRIAALFAGLPAQIEVVEDGAEAWVTVIRLS